MTAYNPQKMRPRKGSAFFLFLEAFNFFLLGRIIY